MIFSLPIKDIRLISSGINYANNLLIFQIRQVIGVLEFMIFATHIEDLWLKFSGI
jgi:hypothetical protein